MNVGEYASCDATELAALIASGVLGAAEVGDAALRAIEQVDPQLNAVVHGPFEPPPPEADGPFSGVPFAVKDTLWEAGRPCEFGSRLVAGHVADRDATLARRFRGAGLVSLVRTATPEFGFNLDTAPVAHGSTRNPWSLGRSPGGSSGGAAALVAARALPMAHGNDAGGSIRVPAAWCGLVGLKPSRGRVPGGPFVGEVPGGLAHEFALTRTVRDAARLLDAVCGPAAGDRYYVAPPSQLFAEALRAQPRNLRVALHADSFSGHDTEPEQRAAVESAGALLEQLGHSVEPASPPLRAGSLRAAHLVLWPWLLALTASGLGALLGREPNPETVEVASFACIRRGLQLTAGHAWKAAAIQNAISRAWGEFMDEYDVFLSPTTATGPPPAGTPAQNDPSYTTAERWLDDVFGLLPYTPIANTTGQPSISLPAGVRSDGLPIGVMLTAQMLREDLLFALAAQLEEALPWADRRPAVVAG